MLRVNQKTIEDTLDVLRTVGLSNSAKYGREFEQNFASNKRIWVMRNELMIAASGIQWGQVPIVITDNAYSAGRKFSWTQYAPMHMTNEVLINEAFLQAISRYGDDATQGYPLGFILPKEKEQELRRIARENQELPYASILQTRQGIVHAYNYPEKTLPTITDISQIGELKH